LNYFDPKVLAGVKNLLLRARFVVNGVMVGIHTSRAKGLSSEFEEHRGYATGDDTNLIVISSRNIVRPRICKPISSWIAVLLWITPPTV
jgi:hypothetical protein